MKHLIVTEDVSSLGIAEYDRIILDSITNEIVYMNGVTYEVVPEEYIYNETDKKYYQKLVAYDKIIKTNATVDLNSEWVSDTEDSNYTYFKSDTYDSETSFSQFKVTWSNLTSITFKYMSNSDMSILLVLKLDSEKFTDQSSYDDIYLTTEGKTPGAYNEFTIECDEGEHHIWFGYVKDQESATDEDRGFIGVPKRIVSVLDVKQGSELPTEYKFGGVSVEGGKTYDININNVTVPNGNIVPSYEDYTKTEKIIAYEYVDLGLPSGLKWAKCNVGASSETEGGVYFQWGETSGVSETLLGKYSDENYSWASYTLCNGTENTLKKYNQSSGYGTVDNKSILDPEDDAATQIMGSDWRMPTKAECQELTDNTTNEWTQVNGVNGYKFTSKTDTSKYIFIPAAGFCNDGSASYVDSLGRVWSSEVDFQTDITSSPNGSWVLGFDSNGVSGGYDFYRCCGLSVRGVHA